MENEIRVLFLASNPLDSSRLRLDEEAREIQHRIELTDSRRSLRFITMLAVRTEDLQYALMKHKPHIVHFSGHGNENKALVFEDRMGNSKAVSQAALSALFKALKGNIRVVVLNACYSEDQARGISENIDYTIGMNDEIDDDAAVVFSSAFYQALGFERTVAEAFEQARVELMIQGIPEENTPIMIVRPGVDDSKLIPPEQPPPAPAKPAQSDPAKSGNRSSTINGEVSGSTIIVGDGNQVSPRRTR